MSAFEWVADAVPDEAVPNIDPVLVLGSELRGLSWHLGVYGKKEISNRFYLQSDSRVANLGTSDAVANLSAPRHRNHDTRSEFGHFSSQKSLQPSISLPQDNRDQFPRKSVHTLHSVNESQTPIANHRRETVSRLRLQRSNLCGYLCHRFSSALCQHIYVHEHQSETSNIKTAIIFLFICLSVHSDNTSH